jgi:hypothetical protein
LVISFEYKRTKSKINQYVGKGGFKTIFIISFGIDKKKGSLSSFTTDDSLAYL